MNYRNVTKEYSKGNAALNGRIRKDRTGRVRLCGWGQWIRKVNPDQIDHKRTGSDRGNNCRKRQESEQNETQTVFAKYRRGDRSGIPGFPSSERPEYL